MKKGWFWRHFCNSAKVPRAGLFIAVWKGIRTADEVIACSRSLTSRRTPLSEHLEQATEVKELERGLKPIEMEVNTAQPW